MIFTETNFPIERYANIYVILLVLHFVLVRQLALGQGMLILHMTEPVVKYYSRTNTTGQGFGETA